MYPRIGAVVLVSCHVRPPDWKNKRTRPGQGQHQKRWIGSSHRYGRGNDDFKEAGERSHAGTTILSLCLPVCEVVRAGSCHRKGI